MKKQVKTFEEFIGDYEVRNLRGKAEDEAEKDGDEIFLDPDTNDPSRSYDDEYDGDDQINRHTINY